VIGTEADGGTGGATVETGVAAEDVGNVAAGVWVVVTSDMTGFCSRGKPPSPGKPRAGYGGADPDGAPSIAATRRARSPI
jgi:hypothetical protein